MIGSTARTRPSTFFFALAFLVFAAPLETRADTEQEIEARIRRIESAILPAVIIAGETPSGPTLAERMAALRVPGVSVAVINGGALEWARGYGVTQIGGPDVSYETPLTRLGLP